MVKIFYFLKIHVKIYKCINFINVINDILPASKIYSGCISETKSLLCILMQRTILPSHFLLYGHTCQ